MMGLMLPGPPGGSDCPAATGWATTRPANANDIGLRKVTAKAIRSSVAPSRCSTSPSFNAQKVSYRIGRPCKHVEAHLEKIDRARRELLRVLHVFVGGLNHARGGVLHAALEADARARFVQFQRRDVGI